MRGGAVLAALAVDFEPEFQVLRVGDFVLGDEPGAERAEGVAAFAFGPLAAAVFLERALGDVVGDAVAGDVVEGVGLAHVLGLLADDDAELDFPVGLRGAAGDADVVVRAVDRAGGLHEEDGLVGDGGAGFGGVLGVVEADAHEFADAADAGAECAVERHRPSGSDVEVERAELIERGGGERVAGEVVDDAGEAADVAGGVEDAGLFLAGRAEAEEFHGEWWSVRVSAESQWRLTDA